jgi:putative restriction endonuclease
MSTVRMFGSIDGVPVGAWFPDRKAVAEAGVHRPLMAGIAGSEHEGADSIVLNGGYEDDQDFGVEVIYTGHGGNDPQARRQVADQELMRKNLALARSCTDGLPVRIVRGWREPSGFGPPSGYRYDGVYRVASYWSDVGRSGFSIWRFHLFRDDAEPAPWTPADGPMQSETEPLARRSTTIQRLVRSSAVSQLVKQLHGYRCQVCEIRLDTAAGPYAEAAHIRPLGRPHEGPDSPDNVLCLCPNHHVQLDTGGIFITDELGVHDILAKRRPTRLHTVPGHQIGRQYLAYHRRLFRRQIHS